ncbi:MAG: hypothetical protein UX90_C0001G0194 [Candidatus Wolfebacteria bacterium GW2011_GWD2_47_17]|nr:MAG: hypothetical protein UX90_C0001G0194 [Candidatus Wolfebacteria bacterium GW2011_GWD2_47_17]
MVRIVVSFTNTGSGVLDVMVGVLYLTTNAALVVDVPPPGVGLVTVTVEVPVLARSVVVTVISSVVELTNAVVRALPFQFATEPETNCCPVTVTVVVASPMNASFGESVVTTGTRLRTTKLCPLEVPPPGVGLKTVIVEVPAVVRSDDGTVISNVVELMNEVIRSESFQRATEDATNPEPVKVTVVVPLCTSVDVGLMAVNTGVGFFTVIVGCDAMFVSAPESSKRDVVVAVYVPKTDGTVTPLVPPPSPYVIVAVPSAASCKKRALIELDGNVKEPGPNTISSAYTVMLSSAALFAIRNP